MSSEVKVPKIPNCDMPDCPNKAYADCKTIEGSWANLCMVHFEILGIGLGTGLGQKYVLEEKNTEVSMCKVEPKCNPCVPGFACPDN